LVAGITQMIARDLSEAGFVVVSSLARGMTRRRIVQVSRTVPSPCSPAARIAPIRDTN